MDISSKIFKQSALSASIATILATTATPVLAQGMPDDDAIEEVVVLGIRGSLINSMNITRNSSGVVSAITAEDIGKFPDTNLAESLQRITGVSIDRANNEGNQVTVRGFGPSFNLVTLNGRQMPNSSALGSAGVSRSFNFREVAAESVKSVHVYKTGRANVASGGIGSTINVVTGKPFDYPGFVAHASAAAVADTSVNTGDDFTPEISGMITNTFADGRFGVLASVSYADRQFGVNRIGTQRFWHGNGYPGQANPDTSAIDTSKNPTLTTWRTVTVDDDIADYQRERLNGQLVLQFAPTDRITASVDYTMGRFEEKGLMNRMSFWFDNVETGAADVNGTIIDPLRTNDELNFWAWEYAFETENDSYGINLDWQATDTLSFELDAHDSTSHANPGLLPAERLANLKNPFGAAAPVTIFADFTGKVPQVGYDDSALTGGAYDPANIEADLYQERGNEIENNIQQIQLHGTWENIDDGALTAINFGIAGTTYKVDKNYIYSANFSLGSNGGALMDLSNLDLGFVPGSGIGFPSVPQYSANQFISLVDAQGLKNPTTFDLDGVEEETMAAYLSFDFDTTFNGKQVRANIGLRYEDTDVEAYSVTTPVVAFNWVTPLRFERITASEQVAETLKGDYDHFLPNLDFSMEVVEDVLARVSYSNTITRSSIGGMFPATTINTTVPGGVFAASQGNPNLLPYESDNLDFSVEWYYEEGSFASIGYFQKKVDNFIATDVEQRVITGPNGPLTDPSVNPRGACPTGDVANPDPDCISQPSDPVILWDVTTPSNKDAAEVDGWEFNVQHMFGDTGFGTIVNYTMVDSSDSFDVYSLVNDYNVPGLSDSANVVAFYEGERWQVRLAYNWRDKFLLRTNGPQEPTFTSDYSQVDISASFNLNDSVTFFAEGINITDEETWRYGRWENQLYDLETYGPRYTIGARISFE